MALDATHYVTEADLDAEGLTEALMGGATRREDLTSNAARMVDQFCRHWFYDRTYGVGTELYLDGRDRAVLHLPAPIVSVEKVEIDTTGLLNWGEVTLDQLRLYDSDTDWQNPKIVRVRGGSNPLTEGTEPIFQKGARNVRIQCHLGMRVLGAPEAIKRVVMRVLSHDRELLSDRYAAEDRAARTGSVKSHKVRERSVAYADRLFAGFVTGDPLVDNVLVRWRRSFS